MRGRMRFMIVMPWLLLLAACEDWVGPWGASGTYALELVNGRALPAAVFTRIGNAAWSVSVVSGELRLRGDGSFRLDLEYLEQEPGAEVRYSTALAGRWEHDGEMVALQYVDPTTGRWRALSAYPRRGTLEFTLPAAGLGVSIRALFER